MSVAAQPTVGDLPDQDPDDNHSARTSFQDASSSVNNVDLDRHPVEVDLSLSPLLHEEPLLSTQQIRDLDSKLLSLPYLDRLMIPAYLRPLAPTPPAPAPTPISRSADPLITVASTPPALTSAKIGSHPAVQVAAGPNSSSTRGPAAAPTDLAWLDSL